MLWGPRWKFLQEKVSLPIGGMLYLAAVSCNQVGAFFVNLDCTNHTGRDSVKFLAVMYFEKPYRGCLRVWFITGCFSEDFVVRRDISQAADLFSADLIGGKIVPLVLDENEGTWI